MPRFFVEAGANCGDEDFALCKCPVCSRIYLIEYEVDTIYLDPKDLDRRLDIEMGGWTFECEACHASFPPSPWIGPDAPEDMQVTWKDLRESSWNWLTERTR